MPSHVVVDGSNLATEGRSQPSLHQLNEAVLAYMAEHPTALITVVVDATFGHRIDSREVPEFDAAVSNNGLVAPPAGAIGRGDAFVLTIANKVNATILSNDSFQEFHGQYSWLFDEGRLVGGKPVPHIGWVFVNRLPVRGPLSRKSVAEVKRKNGGSGTGSGRGRGKAADAGTDASVRVGSADASKPMPVPTAPPPGAVLPGKRGAKVAAATPAPAAPARVAKPAEAAPAEARAAHRHGPVNDLLAFLSFVEHHPVGTRVEAVVDHYSSHGAYVKVGDVVGYLPLRLMADPAPRSARELVKVGEQLTLVVETFVAAKRSIDLAVPQLASVQIAPVAAAKPPRGRKKAAAAVAAPEAAPAKPARGRAAKAATPAAATAEPAAAPAKPSRAKKAAATPAPAPAGATPAPAAKPSRARPPKAAKAAPPEPAAAAPAAPAKKAPSARTAPAAKAAPAAGRPAAAKKAVAKAAAPKKAAPAPAVEPAAKPARRGRAKA